MMKNAKGTVLYVGKAKALRNRVRSYFSRDKDPKTTMLMKKVDSIDYIVCRNEYEALLLENNLIKEHKPHYNINLKDGKSYPAIRITNERFPRVFRTRRIVDDGSRYFGPYPSVYELDRYLELIEKLFPLRKCRGPIKKRDHPCLYYHIGRCAAVCAGKTDQSEYNRRIEGITKLLSGDIKGLVSDLEAQMASEVATLRFERAADIRDTIAAIQTTNEKQNVVDFSPDVRDVLGYYQKNSLVSFAMFHVRSGKLLGTEVFHSEVIGTEEEFLSQFLIQYYSEVRNPPDRLIVGSERTTVLSIAGDLETFFAKEMQNKVEVKAPWSKRDQSIVHLAEENARRDFEKRIRERGHIPDLEELQKLLALPKVPLRIEGFDIAQVSGKHPVASMVSFQNGRPDKSRYRRYHMKSLRGKIDDFAAIREVVARRYTRIVNEDKQLPDLILVDGGKGQVSSAMQVLTALELNIPVLGLAKREEEIFLPDRDDPIRLPEGSAPLRVLQLVRDEAHRFATTFRAQLQTKDLETESLESVPGIGPARSRRLLERFGSVEKIAAASSELVAAEAKIPLETAAAVSTNAKELVATRAKTEKKLAEQTRVATRNRSRRSR